MATALFLFTKAILEAGRLMYSTTVNLLPMQSATFEVVDTLIEVGAKRFVETYYTPSTSIVLNLFVLAW